MYTLGPPTQRAGEGVAAPLDALHHQNAHLSAGRNGHPARHRDQLNTGDWGGRDRTAAGWGVDRTASSRVGSLEKPVEPCVS